MTGLILDSVTVLGAETRGRAVLAASHGGVYAAYLAAKAGVKAVILCDAGVGRERAGIGGLPYLDAFGVAAAAIGHRSARIGDGADCARRGVISFVNRCAQAAGLAPGMAAAAALARLEALDAAPAGTPAPMVEARHEPPEAQAPGVKVVVLDSVSLVTPADAGQIVLTGSHGGLLGGRAATALKIDAFAAVYNDADRGVDDAGLTRLPALDARGIAAACVSAWSARIGDGLSTFRDGFISAINARAAQCGGEIGISTAEFVARMVAARRRELES